MPESAWKGSSGFAVLPRRRATTETKPRPPRCFRRASGGWMGQLRRPRVSGRRRDLHHRPRERHHHSRRAQSVSARNRGRRGAGAGRAQGLRRRVRRGRSGSGHRAAGDRRRNARERTGGARADRAGDHGAGHGDDGLASRCGRSRSAERHPKNVERKTCGATPRRSGFFPASWVPARRRFGCRSRGWRRRRAPGEFARRCGGRWK